MEEVLPYQIMLSGYYEDKWREYTMQVQSENPKSIWLFVRKIDVVIDTVFLWFIDLFWVFNMEYIF